MDSAKLKLKVIIGSTRQKRFSEKPANWIFGELKTRADVDAELLDLRDYPMPFFDEPKSPSTSKGNSYENPIVKKWAAKIAGADGFVIVSPEYNHGYPAVLKNALDYVYAEWNNKPVAFVSYGSVGGGRVIEQLRSVAIELQMAPIRNAVHISGDVYMKAAGIGGPADSEAFKPLTERAKGLFEQLIWWARALKTARSA